MKRIILLGATGSVGANVLDVISRHPDRFEVVGLGSGTRAGALARVAADHPQATLALSGADGDDVLADAARRVVTGPDAMVRLVRETEADLVVNAVVGFVGLEPTMAAVEAGTSVAIANKETVVAGGELLVRTARETGAVLIPIDSEHAAIAQCLRGERLEDVDRVILTASGGSLRGVALSDLAAVTREDALRHPTWNMGEKITVDSATLVNKGLEVIEAHWLFGLSYDAIDVVIHPQSIVHSMVRFIDGSIVAQLGEPDMRLPILFALSWPERTGSSLRHDVLSFPELTFSPVEAERYPCFGHVLDAARAGGAAVTVLNAANEVAVDAFLRGKVPFTRIADTIAAALDQVETSGLTSLGDILDTDARARTWATHFIDRRQTGTA